MDIRGCVRNLVTTNRQRGLLQLLGGGKAHSNYLASTEQNGDEKPPKNTTPSKDPNEGPHVGLRRLTTVSSGIPHNLVIHLHGQAPDRHEHHKN